MNSVKSLLTPGIYRNLGGKPGPFGLYQNQRREKNSERLAPRSFWYDPTGNYLGEGDLGVHDLVRIRDEMPKDEGMFVLLIKALGFNQVALEKKGWPPFLQVEPAYRQFVPPEQLITSPPVWLITTGRVDTIVKDGDTVLTLRAKLGIALPQGLAINPVTEVWALHHLQNLKNE